MNKQEQIEEMAKEIFNSSIAISVVDLAYGLTDNDDHFHRLAKYLYNTGYRKIPDGTVVLTNEEYDKLGLFEQTVQEYKSDNGQLVLVKEQKKLQKYSTDIADFIRKETAKEILQCLYDKCYEIQNMGRGGIAHILPIDILQLAKHYRVEVENEKY